METPQVAAPSRAARHTGLVALAVVLPIHLSVLYWPRVTVTGPVSWADKVVHALVFAAPVLLVALLFPRRRWPVVLLALHAPASELVQHYLLPHRSGDVRDVVADLTGVALAVVLSRWWRSRERWSGAPPGP